jgi:hypothetical protein
MSNDGLSFQYLKVPRKAKLKKSIRGRYVLNYKLFSLFSVMALIACAPSETEAPDNTVASATHAAVAPSDASISAVKAALKSEPNVKDFVYQPGEAVEWQIGVLPDGSSRIGYANYICELISENGAMTDGTRVRIADIIKISQGTSPRDADLGTISCKDRSVF